jgi:hypothetical protein
MENNNDKQVYKLCERQNHEGVIHFPIKDKSGAVVFYKTYRCSRCALKNEQFQRLSDSYHTDFQRSRKQNSGYG